MKKSAIERAFCAIAGRLGTLCGRYGHHFLEMRRVVLNFVIILVLVTAATVFYVEVGHDKGWKRADVWYTCLHNHRHFPWQ